MNVYLAAPTLVKNAFLSGEIKAENTMILESYANIQDWIKPLISHFKSFLLDSGAFTFMSSIKKYENIDWCEYVDKYADFVKLHKINYFFELDIDAIIGLKGVEKLRNRLEKRVGKQCIPVWHLNRGKDYFIECCKDYNYNALGGLVKAGDKNRNNYEQYFNWFINIAHKNNSKLHGLGYTNLNGLKKFHFDSVDSTTWSMGSRYGQIMEFKNKTIIKHNSVSSGVKTRKIKDVNKANIHNFNEWIKFQRYAEKYL